MSLGRLSTRVLRHVRRYPPADVVRIVRNSSPRARWTSLTGTPLSCLSARGGLRGFAAAASLDSAALNRRLWERMRVEAERSEATPRKDGNQKVVGSAKESGAHGKGKEGAKEGRKGMAGKDGKEESGDKKKNVGGKGEPPQRDTSWWLKMGGAAALFSMLVLQELSPPMFFGKEISFQEFTYELLQRGIVDRLEIVDRTTALVYLRPAPTEEDAYGDGGIDPQQFGGYEGSQEFGDGMDFGSSSGSSNVANEASRILNAGRLKYPAFRFNIGDVDTFERKLEQVQEDMNLSPSQFIPVHYLPATSAFGALSYISPSLILVLLMMFMVRNSLQTMVGRGAPSIFQIGKAKTGKVSPKTTFADVAGLGEAKTEILEFVEFLKKPDKYRRLGAKIPRGALLVGPPGTGKTLLAKATAGEAGVPFFSISGSEFIEMFVGVGPARVRDLFAQARGSAPSIIFIDEIDAIGRTRGSRGGFGGGNDERENTLNALLVEMDGFSTTDNVVVLAGTNRADVLDRALLRRGRFDRQINIEKPDIRGRFDILMVHLSPIKVSNKSNAGTDEMQKTKEDLAKKIAAYTPGMSGADLANICNEAALIAARRRGDQVVIEDFENAVDRVIGGLEKKNKVVSTKDREIVAHHEAGHAVAGWHLEHGDPLLKVSIVPRGNAALGFAQYLPQDRVLQNQNQMRDFMIMALGGRAAEALIYGRSSVTTGAQDDLGRVTRLAYAQITNFGMSDQIGKVYFPKAGEQGGSNQFYKMYGEETAEMIDEEAASLVNEAYAACEKLLSSKMDQVKALANRLLEKEVVREEDLVEILGPRKCSKPADYDTFVGRFDRDREERTGQKEDSVDPANTPPIPVEEPSTDSGTDPRGYGGRESSGEKREEEEVIPELA